MFQFQLLPFIMIAETKTKASLVHLSVESEANKLSESRVVSCIKWHTECPNVRDKCYMVCILTVAETANDLITDLTTSQNKNFNFLL